jgi:hypothetical protein
MPDQPLDMLVVRDMPDGLFAVADAGCGVRRAALAFGGGGADSNKNCYA